MKVRLRVMLGCLMALALFGFWLGKVTRGRPAAGESAALIKSAPVTSHRESLGLSIGQNPEVPDKSLEPFENERVLIFRDAASRDRFLKQAGGRVSILGRIDALLALRVGFADWGEISDLLEDEDTASRIIAISTPPLPAGSVQPGAQALGGQLLDWLGVSTDHSTWGAGVRIAVLDTGVASSSLFQSNISNINLIQLPSDLSTQNPHGTAVASLIIGAHEQTPGVAPGAELISVRVADDSGRSDSFLLAQGIVAAVDAGSSLINISMGGFGQSPVLENAVKYAQERGVLIFAATGNNGMNQVFYPAAYEGVVAVGAVDAAGDHLDFSNMGPEVDITAPGYGVNAALPGDQVGSVSGTSFSTPIVVGTVAAAMTAGGATLSPSQAWSRVQNQLNDAGAPGNDAMYGKGMPDMGRVLNTGISGIYDAAVASQRILPPDAGNPYGQVEILIQNRGTEVLVNTAVEIVSGGNRNTSNIGTLAPNAVQTIRIPITNPLGVGNASLVVDSRVSIARGATDAKPSNDHRRVTYEARGN